VVADQLYREIRKLIREMSIANPLWGAPRIHGELLKLGIDIGQTRGQVLYGEKTRTIVARLDAIKLHRLIIPS
jgi:hypothetical protein